MYMVNVLEKGAGIIILIVGNNGPKNCSKTTYLIAKLHIVNKLTY